MHSTRGPNSEEVLPCVELAARGSQFGNGEAGSHDNGATEALRSIHVQIHNEEIDDADNGTWIYSTDNSVLFQGLYSNQGTTTKVSDWNSAWKREKNEI